MYAPQPFREERREVLIEVMQAIQLAALCVPVGEQIEAIHIPLLLTDMGDSLLLEGHIALGNPLWKAIGEGLPALAIFQGPHAYIHPGWYESKRAHGKAVPTWNYVAIHARGMLTIQRDRGWLLQHVTRLSAHNETTRAEPWAVSDAPAAYIDTMTRAIVGLQLRVDHLEGVWKMAQHHSEANRLGVIDGLLQESGNDGHAKAVAEIMKATLFSGD